MMHPDIFQICKKRHMCRFYLFSATDPLIHHCDSTIMEELPVARAEPEDVVGPDRHRSTDLGEATGNFRESIMLPVVLRPARPASAGSPANHPPPDRLITIRPRTPLGNPGGKSFFELRRKTLVQRLKGLKQAMP
jgi:hypothetical protein